MRLFSLTQIGIGNADRAEAELDAPAFDVGGKAV